MKKKYTIIYLDFLGNNIYIPKLKHIQCKNLSYWMKRNFHITNIYFAFDGWIKNTKD